MALLTTIESPDFRPFERAQIAALENAVTGAATEASTGFRDEMRDQVVAAGLGPRLANTWRSKVYPENDVSVNAAGIAYVSSGKDRDGSAPKIMNFNSAQMIVRPLIGRFLAIPTDEVPKKRSGSRLSVAEVEAMFGRRLQFISPDDKGFRTPSIRRGGVAFLVLKNLTVGRSGRYRNASAKEKAAGRRQLSAVIMFILVPQVAGHKRITPDEAFERWSRDYPRLIEAHWDAQSKVFGL